MWTHYCIHTHAHAQTHTLSNAPMHRDPQRASDVFKMSYAACLYIASETQIPDAEASKKKRRHKQNRGAH